MQILWRILQWILINCWKQEQVDMNSCKLVNDWSWVISWQGIGIGQKAWVCNSFHSIKASVFQEALPYHWNVHFLSKIDTGKDHKEPCPHDLSHKHPSLVVRPASAFPHNPCTFLLTAPCLSSHPPTRFFPLLLPVLQNPGSSSQQSETAKIPIAVGATSKPTCFLFILNYLS